MARPDIIVDKVEKLVRESGLSQELGVDLLWLNINAGYEWHAMANPRGWRWQHKLFEKEAEDETVLLDTTLVPDEETVLASQFARWNVETSLDGTLWQPLEYIAWDMMVQRPEFDRVAHVARNQDLFSVEWVDNLTANLQTYPGKYAADPKTLQYRIDMLRALPVLTAASGDTDLLNPPSQDTAIAYAAALHVAMDLGDDALIQRIWNMFHAEELARLKTYGVEKLGIQLTPHGLVMEPAVVQPQEF